MKRVDVWLTADGAVCEDRAQQAVRVEMSLDMVKWLRDSAPNPRLLDQLLEARREAR